MCVSLIIPMQSISKNNIMGLIAHGYGLKMID